MKNQFPLFFIMLVIAMIIWNSCKKADDISNPRIGSLEEKVLASVHGRVTDENGKPVTEVSVHSGANVTTTDVNGFFRFNNIQLSKNAGFVMAEKNNYFKSGRTIFTNAEVVNNIEIKLISKKERGNFQAADGGNINIEDGAAVKLEANGIINISSNAPYSGNVVVFGTYLNPLHPDLASLMPGNLTGLNTSNEQKILQTYGMMAIELRGSSGEKLGLAQNKPAAITFPIPFELQNNTPASIPLWYFNDTLGVWKEEGVAIKQGNAYVGSVSHFSFWNCDIASDFVNLEATLKNQDGQLLSNYRVELKNTQNNSISNGYTDSSGTVRGAVFPGVSLEMKVYNKCNHALYTQTIGPFTKDADLGVLNISIPGAANITVTGRVTKCDEAAVRNGVVDLVLEGLSYRTVVNNGNYSITIERCSAAPENLNVIATDMDAGKQSNLASVSVASGNAVININACEISNEQFIYCKAGSDTFSFVPSSDTLGAFRYGDSTTEITAYYKQNDSLNFQFVTFRFDGPATPGEYITNFILLFRGSPSYLDYLIDSPMTITITEFGRPGEFIAGNFTGTMRSRSTNTPVPGACNFRVRRFL